MQDVVIDRLLTHNNGLPLGVSAQKSLPLSEGTYPDHTELIAILLLSAARYQRILCQYDLLQLKISQSVNLCDDARTDRL
jgi:hypothetical protein